MILATSFLSTDWLKRLSKSRKMEGLHTTRPWGIIQLYDGEKPAIDIFDEDKILSIAIDELPNINSESSSSFRDLSTKITNLTNDLYSAPCAYWLLVACDSGTSKSGAISKWVSDNYLVPIKSLYAGHDVSTSAISRKIYHAIDPNQVRISNFSFDL